MKKTLPPWHCSLSPCPPPSLQNKSFPRHDTVSIKDTREKRSCRDSVQRISKWECFSKHIPFNGNGINWRQKVAFSTQASQSAWPVCLCVVFVCFLYTKTLRQPSESSYFGFCILSSIFKSIMFTASGIIEYDKKKQKKHCTFTLKVHILDPAQWFSFMCGQQIDSAIELSLCIQKFLA